MSMGVWFTAVTDTLAPSHPRLQRVPWASVSPAYVHGREGSGAERTGEHPTA